MSRMSLLRHGLPSALLLAVAGVAHGQPAPEMSPPQSPSVPYPSTFVPAPPADTQALPNADRDLGPPAQSPDTAPPGQAPPPQMPPVAPPTALPPIGGQPGGGDSGAIAPPSALTAPPPVAVEAAPLRAPDLFSTEAGATGLPGDLWKGASVDLARTVIPLLSARPLSPAAAAFGRRLMATAAPAPAGGGSDADLAAARVGAVLALGDAAAAHAMLEHTPGVRQSATLSQVSAEADLVLGREDEACRIGDDLVVGKDGPYWRRLRAFCLLKAGDKAGAQLAYDLAAEQAKDDIYKRLMGAAVSGAPGGDASLRNGMEYALSRRLQLDLAPAMDKAWAPIPPVVVKDPTASPAAQAAATARVQARLNDVSRASDLDPSVRDAALSLADDKLAEGQTDNLAAAGEGGAAQAQAATALYLAAGAPANAHVRTAFAGFDVGGSRASQARLLALDAASGGGAKGDAALLALWLAAEAGEAGPGPADRARIVRALMRAGFRQDARAYALEGLLSLQPPAPPPAAPPARKAPAAAPARRKR
jgi:hypothetical protein